ncbi:hypothetical protein BH10BAC2_BH10BAC2_25840 [soil metagenome]
MSAPLKVLRYECPAISAAQIFTSSYKAEYFYAAGCRISIKLCCVAHLYCMSRISAVVRIHLSATIKAQLNSNRTIVRRNESPIAALQLST